MSRWFAEARAIVERHGGTVEKFIGDEVMAVFGVPVVHEDDALRAVRSASALRDRLVSLNDELEASYGVRLAVRIGVNTGEVVVGDPSTGGTFVTGEPVNMAKRLEQAAAPGADPDRQDDVPAGRERRAGRPARVVPREGQAGGCLAVGVDRSTPAPPASPAATTRARRPRGGAGPARGGVRGAAGEPDVPARHAARPGRDRQDAPGGGAARDRSGAAPRVLTGRCLPYGDGITFWPLVELLRALGPDGLRRRSPTSRTRRRAGAARAT